MNGPRIAVLTDSGTNTPSDFARAHGVTVVPLSINYSDGTYHTDVDITTDEVIRRFAREVPTTSLPSPSTLLRALERVRDEGAEGAVFVTISSGLSATNQTVTMVASQMPDFPVAVIDTKSIGVAAGMVTMNAALKAEAGLPLATIKERLNALSEDTLVLFCVDELAFLRRGGRISEATYRLGSALNIKPVFECDDEGRYRVVRKCRGLQKAHRAIEELIAERARQFGEVVLAICSAAAGFDFAGAEAALRSRIPNAIGCIHSGITADLIVHTGATLMGMAVQPATPEMAAWLASGA